MRTRNVLASVAVLAVLAAPLTAAAQQTDRLPVGTRVRVHLLNPPPPVVTGVLVGSDSGGLTIAAPDGSRRRIIPTAEVARLERYVSARPAGVAFRRGAKRGALVGLGLSAVYLTAGLVAERRDPCQDCMFPVPIVAAVVTVPVTAGSALIGGVIGVGTRHRWARVAYP